MGNKVKYNLSLYSTQTVKVNYTTTIKTQLIK